MAHNLFRTGRLMVVAVLALLATACGTSNQDENRPKTALASATSPSEAERPETRLAAVQTRVAREAFDQGSLGTAQDLFEKAHENAPRSAAPLIGKGDVLFAQQRFDAAEAAYRAALQRDRASFEANEGLGKTLVTLKKFHDGLRAFQAARAVRADAALINKIGVTHELLGDGAAAQDRFREALSLDAGSLTARNNLALSLAVSGSYDAALREMEKVVAAPGSSERHHANLAFIYGLAGRSLDRAPARVLRAAANKGWNEEFFARTRKVAETGDRAAILDLLNNRAPTATALPEAAQLPEMPEIPATPETVAGGAASAAPATAAPMPLSRPAMPEIAATSAPMAADAGNGPISVVPPAKTPADNRPTAVIDPAPESAPEPAPADLQGETAAPETVTALQTATPAPAVTVAPPAADAPAPDAAYRVQLGAYATPWLGRALRALGEGTGGLLPGNRVEVVRGQAFHTLRSAQIDDLGEARRICTSLRGRKIECFVTRQTRPPAGQGFDITGANDPAALAAFLASVEPIAPQAEGSAADPKTTVAALHPTPDAGAAPAGSGAYRIQFAAYRRAAHLVRGLEVLRRKAGDALPAIESLVRAETPSGTSIPYRLRSAALESRAAAVDLCKSLSEKGVECLVIRHGTTAWHPLS